MRTIFLFLGIGLLSAPCAANFSPDVTLFQLNGHDSAFVQSACGGGTPMLAVYARVAVSVSPGSYSYTFKVIRDGTVVAQETDWMTELVDYGTSELEYWTTIPAVSGTYVFEIDFWGDVAKSQSIAYTLNQSQSGPPTAWSSINGVSAYENPIDVCSAGPIILDGTKSSCASKYFVGIELSDRWWNGYGGGYGQWLTTKEYSKYGLINGFDLKRFAEDHFFAFVPGQYYRVTLAVGNPWNEHTKVIAIQPTVVSLRINGASDQMLDVLGPAYPIMLNASASSCAKSYFLSVQLSDAQWNRYGDEAMKVLNASDFKDYGPPANFDIRRFGEAHGLSFLPGRYYRVKLAVGPGWNDTTMLVHLVPPKTPPVPCIGPCRPEHVPKPLPD